MSVRVPDHHVDPAAGLRHLHSIVRHLRHQRGRHRLLGPVPRAPPPPTLLDPAFVYLPQFSDRLRSRGSIHPHHRHVHPSGGADVLRPFSIHFAHETRRIHVLGFPANCGDDRVLDGIPRGSRRHRLPVLLLRLARLRFRQGLLDRLVPRRRRLPVRSRNIPSTKLTPLFAEDEETNHILTI